MGSAWGWYLLLMSTSVVPWWVSVVDRVHETSTQVQGCRAAKFSGTNGNHGWPLPVLRWVTGKEWLPSALSLFPVNDGTHGRSSSPEKDAEEIKESADEDGSAQFSEADGAVRRSRQAVGGNRQDRKMQRYRAQRLAAQLQGDTTHEQDCHPSLEKLCQSAPSERLCLHKSIISQVPLRLLIKVSGQRGGLGISIAGGKGSLPYKENDEGIFISRVSKGGPAEKAGVHIGDRVLEVNGQDMREVSHHEAVSALRNAGSCIKMKVLRDRPPHLDSRMLSEPDDGETDPVMIRQWADAESSGRVRGAQPFSDASLGCAQLINRIEAVVCNGKGLSDLAQEIKLGKDRETSFKTSTLQAGKHTMTIPRIILTHPSTSDEEVEPLTHGADGEFDESDDPDDHIYSDLSSAFCRP